MCGKNHLKELGTGFDSEWRDPAHGTWLANRVWKKTKGWTLGVAAIAQDLSV